MKRALTLSFLAITLSLGALLASCGGGGASTPPVVVVSLSAAAKALDAGGQTTITAVVSNDASNQGVRWSISPASGAGSLINVTPTSITYQAPATLAANGTVTITATALADKMTSASLSIQLEAITVSVSASTPSIGAGGTAVITAAVSNDLSNQGVSWSISPASGAGTLTNITSTSATYNAPATPPASDVQVTITATAAADSSKSGAVTITFSAIQVSVAASAGSVQAGGTITMTATVSNDSSNQGVTWSLSPTAGAGTLSSTTTTSVTYNAPATPPTSDLGITITATSISDKRISGNVTVTVLAITVGVAPATALIPVTATQQYTATINNDPTNKGAAWTVTQNGTACSPGCGTVAPTSTPNGTATTYTAPATVPATPAVTLTAGSVEDNTKSAAASITLTAGTVKLVPIVLNFGSIKVNFGFRTLTTTLTNTGAAVLSVSSMNIAGTGIFTQTNNCMPTVAAGASCAITITFKPGSFGQKNAVLSISDSSVDSPQQVQLSGEGFTRALAGAAVQSAVMRSASIAAPSTRVPARVGTRVMEFVDTAREDPYLANGTKRDLLVRFWYPASLAQACQAAEYTSAQVWSYFSQLKKISLPQVRTNSCWNAPISGGPHPVVVFTHGYTGTFTDYTFLFEDLASRGYVVASVDHTYEATAVEFPDGRLAKSVVGSYLGGNARTDEKTITFAVGVRLGDLKFVLNELERLNSGSNNPFAGQLDMSRVALAGHSVGGLTTLLGVEEEPRFRAGVILDGILPEIVTPSAQTPVLVVTMGNDAWGADDCRLWNGLRGSRLAVNLKGTEHMTPSDAVWIARYAIKTGSMGTERTVAAVRDYVAAFLDVHLMGKPASRLLRGTSPKYPDAVLTTHTPSACGQP